MPHAAHFSPLVRPAAITAASASRRSTVHRLALLLVWLAVASGAVVFTEPAPVDVLTMALVIGLPAVGLVTLPRAILVMFAFWLIAAAAAFVASAHATAFDVALKHSAVSLYLYVATFVLAGFVALKPNQHTEHIFNAYTFGAVLAAIAGIVGYFGLVPGAAELFTKYGRAAGPFKDPNVFGPFLIPAILYAIHSILSGRRNGLVVITTLALLSLGVLVSFSRGAWANLAVALIIYGAMTFVASRLNRDRLAIVLLALGGCIFTVIVLITALQFDKFAKLMKERAALTQSYDVGPNGRFGGQDKAIDLIVENPFGIGALEFRERHHHEEVHNVYLSMFLNAGWLGGLSFFGVVLLTCLFGLRTAFRRTSMQPLLIVAVAAFTGNALEGIIVDIDHWRHFYLLMAIVWGLSTASRLASISPPRERRPARIISRSQQSVLVPFRAGRQKPPRGRRPRLVINPA